jgi:hypothetical protein
VPAPSDVRWQLLTKAEQAEAMFKALLVKVTSEKNVTALECDRLAAFRQGLSVSTRIHHSRRAARVVGKRGHACGRRIHGLPRLQGPFWLLRHAAGTTTLEVWRHSQASTNN